MIRNENFSLGNKFPEKVSFGQGRKGLESRIEIGRRGSRVNILVPQRPWEPIAGVPYEVVVGRNIGKWRYGEIFLVSPVDASRDELALAREKEREGEAKKEEEAALEDERMAARKRAEELRPRVEAAMKALKEWTGEAKDFFGFSGLKVEEGLAKWQAELIKETLSKVEEVKGIGPQVSLALQRAREAVDEVKRANEPKLQGLFARRGEIDREIRNLCRSSTNFAEEVTFKGKKVKVSKELQVEKWVERECLETVDPDRVSFGPYSSSGTEWVKGSHKVWVQIKDPELRSLAIGIFGEDLFLRKEEAKNSEKEVKELEKEVYEKSKAAWFAVMNVAGPKISARAEEMRNSWREFCKS